MTDEGLLHMYAGYLFIVIKAIQKQKNCSLEEAKKEVFKMLGI